MRQTSEINSVRLDKIANNAGPCNDTGRSQLAKDKILVALNYVSSISAIILKEDAGIYSGSCKRC